MVQNYAYLAHGSAFYHGSNTDLGGACDVRLNDLFTFLAYQAATENLLPSDSSVIHDLSLKPRYNCAELHSSTTVYALNSMSSSPSFHEYNRSMSVFEMTAHLQDVFLTQPIQVWEREINALDVPGIVEGMCAFFTTSLSLYVETEEQLGNIMRLILDLLGLVI